MSLFMAILVSRHFQLFVTRCNWQSVRGSDKYADEWKSVRVLRMAANIWYSVVSAETSSFYCAEVVHSVCFRGIRGELKIEVRLMPFCVDMKSFRHFSYNVLFFSCKSSFSYAGQKRCEPLFNQRTPSKQLVAVPGSLYMLPGTWSV